MKNSAKTQIPSTVGYSNDEPVGRTAGGKLVDPVYQEDCDHFPLALLLSYR